MNNSTEMTGLRLSDRLQQLWHKQSYPLASFGYAAGGMVLSMSRIIGGLSPFGVAFAAAVPFRFTLPSTLGIVIGYLLCGGMSQSYRYVGAVLLVTLCRWIFGQERWDKHREWLAPVVSIIAVLIAGVLPLLYTEPLVYDVIMWSAQIVIAGAAASFLHRGLDVIEKRTEPSDRLGGLAFAVLLAMLLMGLDSISFSEVTLGRVAAAAAVLLAVRVRGESWASMTGVVCGLVMGFSTGNITLYVTAYSLGGLLAGVFSSFGRLGSTLAFTMTYGFIGVLVQGSMAGFIEVALAAVAFLMIPSSWLRMAASAASTVTTDDDTVRALMEDRLLTAALALEDVSRTTREVAKRLQDAAGGEENAIADKIAEKVCRKCSYCKTCWCTDFNGTMDALNKGLTALRQNKSLSPEDFGQSFHKCVKRPTIAKLMAEEYLACQSRKVTRRRADRMRSVVTEQFDGLSMALRGVVTDVSDIMSSDRILAAKLREVFLEHKLEPQSICCYKTREGHMAIRAELPRYKESRILWEPLIRDLEAVAERKLGYPKTMRRNRVVQYTLYERPTFCGEYGSYQLSCDGKSVCGDTFRILTTQGYNAHIVLSDGMGSGKSAAVDSTMAASLIARLLEAGIDYQSALKLINSALLVKSGEESLATIDAVRIDLFSGKARLYKAGAGPTLVLKKGRGVEIESTSLPAGILGGVEFEQSELSLDENDLVLMMSDGATADGCQWIVKELEEYKENDLNELCRRIAEKARESRSGSRADDVTVVCCRLIRNPLSK
ncbi:MAG: SpoIIE family protein phosphatase [Angelakisella sp.]|nr:SpoIIE family protein phosphatase [Angelakisella sp.]